MRHIQVSVHKLVGFNVTNDSQDTLRDNQNN